ncbi:HET-domain-containing protein, partial [Mytilinidion resinicola]
YLALSYCWGTQNTLKSHLQLNKSTLAELKTSINTNKIAITLQEALRATYTLRYRFIWIDALCIIQGDENDWQTESASISRIYASATITLVPAAIESCDEGFLDRTIPPLLLVSFRSSHRPDLTGNFYLQATNADTHITEWNKRGWTFQELLESRRLLYFSKTMLHYSCQTVVRVESREEATSATEGFYTPWAWTHKELGVSAWFGAVREYSGRLLSNPSDKLPAISARAHDIAAQSQSQYLAGLWRDSLVLGLLWYCVDPQVDKYDSDT